MVAALSRSRHGPLSSSAARSSTAARSSNGSSRQAGAARKGRLDRALGVLAGGVAAGAEDVGVVVRGDDVERRAAREVPGPVDGHRQLVVDAAELGERA
jgi:hypothetical protein